MRDLTEEQFRQACSRHGFKPAGFLGYYEIAHGRSVSIFNAGPSRRAQLAYLIKAADQAAKEARNG